MSATLRRTEILTIIQNAKAPVSASLLAKNLQVSRQLIVGDVALLRAQGHDIIATARGYIIPALRNENRYLGKIACSHTPDATKAELYIIVDSGAVVVDVIVEHDIYGEISGQLNLQNRDEVDAFMDKVYHEEVKLLSELTQGVHLHTLACRDKTHFDLVCEQLSASGYLLDN